MHYPPQTQALQIGELSPSSAGQSEFLVASGRFKVSKHEVVDGVHHITVEHSSVGGVRVPSYQEETERKQNESAENDRQLKDQLSKDPNHRMHGTGTGQSLGCTCNKCKNYKYDDSQDPGA
jgi:hypothetical protein